MDDVLVVVRLALAAMFAVAAVAKLTDREGTLASARALGVPGPVATLVPFGLPGVELVLAALLWPVSTAPWAAAAAAVLMAGFIVLLAFNLIKGRRPSCHCFGALDAAPISGRTLARNAVLLALALLVFGAGRRDGADVFAGGPWVDVLAFAGVVALAVGLTRSRPQPAEVDESIDPGPPPGSVPVGEPAPDFALPDAYGREVSLATLRARGLPVVLVFGTLGCPSCVALLPDIEAWQRELGDHLVVAFIVSAAGDRAQEVAEQFGLEHLLVQKGAAVTDLYGVVIPPAAVVVRPDGTVGSVPVAGPEAIRKLVEEVTGRPVTPFAPTEDTINLLGPAPVLAVGATAPDFRLPSSMGPSLSRRDLRSGALAFVFVQRRCSQCSDLLDQLSYRTDLSARAVVVSSGPGVPLVPEGLVCPVLVDGPGFLPASFGVAAFPSAVIVDQNVVASPLAVGMDAVLELLAQVRDLEPIDADHITEGFVPRPNPSVVTFALDGVTVVGDPATGRFHTLDGPGKLLWSCFDGGESLGEIASALSLELGVAPEVMRDDVLNFARRLGRDGALDGVRPDAAAPQVEETAPA